MRRKGKNPKNPFRLQLPKRCIYCGKTRPRTIVANGYAHKRCIPK